ncbi:permease [Lysinibacillus fusiformis]|uniref:permease n=1 Tax=Lysinibacillus fusiformis TaxID=28031 RepID=UPI00215AE4F9|nr:permease [Lysinibacillus fusiformis]MCR8851866.1 permease [Lysinibacillus fusiformis]WKT78371.1 permease [Lysinibacillus fusiformis]
MERLSFSKYTLNFWLLFILFISFLSLLLFNISALNNLSSSLLSLNTIFLSILIEALPFVLIGILIAGFIQIFITEEHIQRWIPRNPLMAVVMSCLVGALFPACECGIVPIVKRVIAKGVPIHAAMGFMLTGPLINPIVILSTYMAFGNDLRIASLRMLVGFVIAIVVALLISLFFKGSQFKSSLQPFSFTTTNQQTSFVTKLMNMFKHAIDEFFDVGKYLIIGAFLAAFVQTYVSTKTLIEIGDGVSSSILVMMGLAFILSLCSEADAFIGASFSAVFSTPSILAFLIFGPMIDLKNTIMLMSVFRLKFVFSLIALVAIVVYISIWILSAYL